MRRSVVPPDEPSLRPSHEPSCEEKGLSEASREPSYESKYHLNVHMKFQVNIFHQMKVKGVCQYAISIFPFFSNGFIKYSQK